MTAAAQTMTAAMLATWSVCLALPGLRCVVTAAGPGGGGAGWIYGGALLSAAAGCGGVAWSLWH